jgi:ubiquitin C-terminal hydrolase
MKKNNPILTQMDSQVNSIKDKVVELQKNMAATTPEENVKHREDLANIVVTHNESNTLVKEMVNNKSAQQDASEFLVPLFDALFAGNQTSICSSIEIIHEYKTLYHLPKKDIQPSPILNIPFIQNQNESNFSELISKFQEPEKMGGNNQYQATKKSDNSQENVDATKQLILNFPKESKEVVFSLSRFKYQDGQLSKIDTNVTFDQLSINQKSFEITAFIHHKGTLNSGHYTTYIKENDDKWYCYNDNIKSKVDETTLESNKKKPML